MRSLYLCALTLVFTTSCAVSDRVVYSDSEGVVPETFFSTVKKRKTRKEWIIGNLGQPNAVDEDSGIEFLTYHFAKSRYRKVSVMLVLNRGVLEEEDEYYHVMVCNDIVKRAWFDRYPVVDARRHAAKSKCEKESL